MKNVLANIILIVYTNTMENQMMIGVWIISLLMSFIPMSLTYKIVGTVICIALIAGYIIIASRNNRLSKVSLIINLIIIGWDLAVLYTMVSVR